MSKNYKALVRMRASLSDMEELYTEVTNGFVPKRFRDANFSAQLKKEYLSYLSEEITALQTRISRMENGDSKESR